WRGVPPEMHEGAFRWAAPDGSEVTLIWLYDDFGYSNAAMLPLEAGALSARARQIAERMRSQAVSNVLLLMNGSAHLQPQTGLPAIIDQANQQLEREHLRMIIGTLPQYVNVLKKGTPPLGQHVGELRSSYRAHLLPGVLSTRMWLKQQNAASEA